MSDELQSNLEQYKVQLQQVEAALSAEPENEELKKLKVDLDEIINLTQELIQPSTGASKSTGSKGGGGGAGRQGDNDEASDQGDDDEPGNSKAEPAKQWRVGDKCMAVWSKNSQHYEAIIEGIADGKAAVAFVGYNVTEMNKLSQLRSYVDPPPSKKYVFDSSNKKGAGNRAQFQADKERRRAKALKKAQRWKQVEEEKEADKNKWKAFATKAMAKSMKGVKRESIFATSESSGGRVGVGTCGVSGKPMTKTTVPQTSYTASTSKVNRAPF